MRTRISPQENFLQIKRINLKFSILKIVICANFSKLNNSNRRACRFHSNTTACRTDRGIGLDYGTSSVAYNCQKGFFCEGKWLF